MMGVEEEAANITEKCQVRIILPFNNVLKSY